MRGERNRVWEENKNKIKEKQKTSKNRYGRIVGEKSIHNLTKDKMEEEWRTKGNRLWTRREKREKKTSKNQYGRVEGEK